MERPLEALLDGMKQLWIEIESREGKFPPVSVSWWKISNNKVRMDGTVSSQFFTALMNIWGHIEWGLEIEVVWGLVSKPYIDMTILELSKFGIEVENDNYESFKISPNLTFPPSGGREGES